VPTDIRPNRGDICGGRRVLVAIGDLDRDPLKKLVAKAGETTRLDRFDQHVKVFRSDDDGWPPFV
jgi:hypothetical protein